MSSSSNHPTSARIIYPHQLFLEHFSVSRSTLLVLVEDDLFFRQYRFHKQKLILHRASMQEFKIAAEAKGYSVTYLETSQKTASMKNLETLLMKQAIKHVSYYDLTDNWLELRLTKLLERIAVSSERYNSPGFVTTRGQINEYFDTHPQRMQHFYEWQRKRLNILVKNNQPVGGKWSFDEANRKKLPRTIDIPKPYPGVSNAASKEAIEWVEKTFPNNPGSSHNFRYPVTHAHAKKWLADFIAHRLPTFGPYEDAISSTHQEIFHSLLSPLLNIGLLTPNQVIQEIQKLPADTVPIESLEGFMRQLIGWREYMRATYLLHGSTMRTQNHLGFTKSIPSSWWRGTVGIEPIDTVIKNVLQTGYAHHIERLMVLGNSMVLLRFSPDEVYEWFMSLFIDAYDWVMVPNVYAMSQFAAGDLITTKPYISGSNYIIKMSDYKKGEWSDIWDSLYWQFVHDHCQLLEANFRSAMMVKLYDRMDPSKKSKHAKLARKWLS